MTDRPLAAPVGGLFGSRLLADAAERILLRALSRIRIGRLTVVMPDGRRRVLGERESDVQGEIHVHDRAALVRLLIDGETGAGEGYMAGDWSSPDLAALLRLAALNRSQLSLTGGWWRLPTHWLRVVAHRLNRNTLGRARRNIASHYDLSNDLYRLFLDETMTYSSAVFTSETQSLADAQREKYRRMAAKAGVRAGMHVLEIGSGWGGFALHAAGELGARVTTITLSEEQLRLARERVAEAGLSDLVSVELRDYREVRGQYDAIVSIEMLEAVGHEYFGTFFAACDALLRPGGRMAVQSITYPDARYEDQRRGANWIQKYIFPGGLLPSLAVIERSLAGTSLLVTGVEDIAPSYARTLAEWRRRFMASLDSVRALGFDDRFIRMWEYYLALSEAGFAAGIFQDLQISFEKRDASFRDG
ncbi:MAG TPA: cyclopropane-fatty-acyl-phospholipid synthase family protein [Candidatus Limnocylindria bacterium]|nr:cyclopropane-fatty-acyl-phospholipid synthase family protein [Candidatus Limnocylindria bacterium]